MLAIFFFGGDSIKGFMFALIVGVVVGTYSSLFVATPIMFDVSKKEGKRINNTLLYIRKTVLNNIQNGFFIQLSSNYLCTIMKITKLHDLYFKEFISD